MPEGYLVPHSAIHGVLAWLDRVSALGDIENPFRLRLRSWVLR